MGRREPLIALLEMFHGTNRHSFVPTFISLTQRVTSGVSLSPSGSPFPPVCNDNPSYNTDLPGLVDFSNGVSEVRGL